MAVLLVLFAVLAFVFGGAGFGSSSTSSGTATMPRRITTYSRQVTTTGSHVTVRTRVTTRGSVSCTARVRIKGASVQQTHRCRYSPVSP
ncbi:MAG TPA: hypothetical protein VLD16_04770 [Gaiellaceae bacterium]|nr:hypothetical protein [Gaiellaceae bacterium]